MDAGIITAIALGIGLSASTGFRVFVPMLVASIAAYFDVLPLNDSFEWLGSVPALITFGVAAIVEIVAYYVPFVDNVLDTIATPMAVIAGTLLMTSVLPIDDSLTRWVTGFIVGGGVSAVVQSGSVFSRLLSSQATAGMGNSAVSTGENVGAVGLSVGALFVPILIAIITLVLVIVIPIIVYRRRKYKKTHVDA
ncbi:MAG: DUF4126 domain-containing protein [Bacteroidales bacterium]|uniref:DUF4126 domain-containing protein n=1 Tax=Porphyromonas sp. TaxID=1924944 RepID=UPI0029752815|nr:DUF4126 family protein [Porphyromonas sp.]MDD7437687.1 DUF4126 domain-containing protein [Bacteroidales bacterium]MDY3067634.1 DUF4126 domain-containing protein [Porphyromonas sp.]